MSSTIENKIYELYEIFNDYNQIIILLSLFDEELTLKELVKKTKLKKATIFNHLEYLSSCNILIKKEKNNKTYYKIKDRNLNKLIGKIANYVNK